MRGRREEPGDERERGEGGGATQEGSSAAKWRRMVLKEPVARKLKEIFTGVAERYGFRIEEQEVMPDHVHLFVSAPPRYSPS